MGIVDDFKKIKGNASEKLAGQISLTEKLLVEKGYSYTVRFIHGTINWFYHKDGEPVVLVVYYSTYSWLTSFATMDKEVYDKWFADTNKKVAFTPRTDGKMKAIVSMNGTYVPLAHLALDIPAGYCVDHKYHCIWLNDSFCIRPCTYSQNNRNRKCSKRRVGDEFDYDPACDFSEKWWLVLCVTMFHELTWEQAKAYNMGGDVE